MKDDDAEMIEAILEVILAAHRNGATREEIVFMLRRAADDIEGQP